MTSLKSADPVSPSSPDSLLSARSTSSVDIPATRPRCPAIPGSRSPGRVPMTSPSNGVSPIEVSTLRPPRTAVALAPLPRCSTTQHTSSTGRPSNAATRRET